MSLRQAQLAEAVQKLDSEAAAARQRLLQLVSAGKARASQLQRQEAAAAAARAAEQDAYDKRCEVRAVCCVLRLTCFPCCCQLLGVTARQL
jgi:hypothetical protein